MKCLLVADCAAAACRLERLLCLAFGVAEVSVVLHRDAPGPALSPRLVEADFVMVDPGTAGLDWLERVPGAALSTVVVTDDCSLALRAFELGVGDYLLNPVSPTRLTKALRRVAGGGRGSEPRAANLALRKAGGIELIPMEELLYVRGADNYSEIVLKGGRRELHDETLAALTFSLRRDFVRVHKSYLVRVSAMRRLMPRRGNQYAVELADGGQLPLGRTYYRALRERLLGRTHPGGPSGTTPDGGWTPAGRVQRVRISS